MIHKVNNVKLVKRNGEKIKCDLEMFMTTERNGFYIDVRLKDKEGFTILCDMFSMSTNDRVDLVSNRRDYYVVEDLYLKSVLSIRNKEIRVYKESDFYSIELNRNLYNEEFRDGFTRVFEGCLHKRFKMSDHDLRELKLKLKDIAQPIKFNFIEYIF